MIQLLSNQRFDREIFFFILMKIYQLLKIARPLKRNVNNIQLSFVNIQYRDADEFYLLRVNSHWKRKRKEQIFEEFLNHSNETCDLIKWIFSHAFSIWTRDVKSARIHLHHLHYYNYLMTFYRFFSFVLQSFGRFYYKSWIKIKDSFFLCDKSF